MQKYQRDEIYQCHQGMKRTSCFLILKQLANNRNVQPSWMVRVRRTVPQPPPYLLRALPPGAKAHPCWALLGWPCSSSQYIFRRRILRNCRFIARSRYCVSYLLLCFPFSRTEMYYELAFLFLGHMYLQLAIPLVGII